MKQLYLFITFISLVVSACDDEAPADYSKVYLLNIRGEEVSGNEYKYRRNV